MISMLAAYRQKTRLLHHDLWIAQRADGSWQVWIDGEKGVTHDLFLANQEEAKRAVHSLAHWHIEGKHLCDCPDELCWEAVPPDPAHDERRRLKRTSYICEIRCEDQGLFRIGRIGNLSVEGAFIQTSNPSYTGSVVTLTFQIGHLQVETQGQVVHRNPDQGMGVRFVNLNPSYRAAIADVLIRNGD